MNIDSNLLFGIMAFQDDYIDLAQLSTVVETLRKGHTTSVSQDLLDRGWIDRESCSELQRKLDRKLKRYDHSVPPKSGETGTSPSTVAATGAGAATERQRASETLAPPETTSGYTMVPRAQTARRYLLNRVLGEGGIGRVWVARDTGLNRDVAMKELRPDRTGSPEASRRFLMEAQITGQLEHPNIVPIYELSRRPEDDQPFYIMQLIRGQTLSEAIAKFHDDRRAGRHSRLDHARLLGIFVSVSNAVAYANSRGVLHRDLKPENVVLGDFGAVVVLDWGLAKLVGRSDESARAVTVDHDVDAQEFADGRILGTPGYMAPEQAEGRADQFDARTDVYGLGAILFEILTGHEPHRGRNTNDVLQQIIMGDTPRARAVEPSVSPPLSAVCAKAMAKNRSDRYANASELAGEVQRWLVDEPVVAYPERWFLKLARWSRQHRAWTGAVAVALLTVSVASTLATIFVGRARRQEVLARQEATERFRQAREAVDTLLVGVSDGLKHIAGAQAVRKQLLQKAADSYGEFAASHSQDRALKAESARSHLRLGKVRLSLDDFSGAIESCRTAQQAFEELARDEPDRIEFQIGAAESQNQLGVVLTEHGTPADARDALESAASLLHQLRRAHPDDPAIRELLAETQTSLGNAFQDLGKFDDAERAHQLAVIEFDGLLQVSVEERRTNLLFGQARSLNNLANLHLRADRADQAHVVYTRAIQNLKELEEREGKIPEYLDRLAISSNNHGLLLERMNQPEAAENALRVSVAAYNALVFTSESDLRLRLIEARRNLGDVLVDRGQAAEAKVEFRRAIDEGFALVRDFPGNLRVKEALALAETNLAAVLVETPEDATEAMEMASKAVQHFGSLVDRAPDDADLAANLRRCLHVRSQAFLKLGHADEAAADAARFSSLLTKDERDAEYLYNAACVLSQSSALAQTANRHEEARQFALAAVEKLSLAFDAGFAQFDHLKQDSDLDPVRSLPAFVELLEKHGVKP